VALLSTMEASSASSLCWGCLAALVSCWGRKARCLTALPLILTSFQLGSVGGTVAAAEGTASEIATDVDVDSGVDIPEGDST
jgi:hypothetical protein